MKRFIIAVSMTIAFFATVIHRDSLADEGIFIQNLLSGKCIDVVGAPGQTNEARLQLWDCEEFSGKGPGGTPTDQKWVLTADGYIQNRLSGKCIDVVGSPGQTNEARLQLWDCEISGKGPGGTPTDQKWVWTADGYIQNRLSGKCIDVVGAPGQTNEARLQLWDCEISGKGPGGTPTDQRWRSSAQPHSVPGLGLATSSGSGTDSNTGTPPESCKGKGEPCQIHPSECSGRGNKWVVAGTIQCVNGIPQCKAEAGKDYCKQCGGDCGSCFGQSCSQTHLCTPGQVCVLSKSSINDPGRYECRQIGKVGNVGCTQIQNLCWAKNEVGKEQLGCVEGNPR